MARNALLIAHDATSRARLQESLRGCGFQVDGTRTASEAARRIAEQVPDVVLMDLDPAPGTGLFLVERALRDKPSAVLAVAPKVNDAVRRGASHLTAHGVLTRNAAPAEVEHAIARALAPNTFAHHLLRAHHEGVYDCGANWHMVGLSQALRTMHRKVVLAARNGAEPVLTEGPPGTESATLARALHAKTTDLNGPLLHVRCGASTEEQLAVDLFGAEPSASLHIAHPRAGLLEAAENGTLVIDRIGRMPLDLQARLLRAMESGFFCRMGATKLLPLRARIIASAECDLAERVAARAFRADLHEHLGRFAIQTPPLRERREDILPLASYIFRKAAASLGLAVHGFEEEAISRLVEHDWPGNTHELRCRLHAVLFTAQPPLLGAAALGITAPPAAEAMADMERAHILRMLNKYRWKKAEVARRLGINRTTLWHKINRFALEEPPG